MTDVLIVVGAIVVGPLGGMLIVGFFIWLEG